MSFKWTAAAFDAKVGNSTAKLILIKMADNANDEGECWPSYKTLAAAAECSRRTVINQVKKLQDRGYILSEKRERNDGSTTSNMYKLIYNMNGQPLHPPSETVVAPPPSETVAPLEPIIYEPPENKKSIKKNSYSPEFDECWKLYGRKGVKSEAWKQWQKLEHNDHTQVLDSIEYYFLEQPTPQYRKDLERYLKYKVFESVMERADNKCLNVNEQKPETGNVPPERNIGYSSDDFYQDEAGNCILKPGIHKDQIQDGLFDD